MAIGKSVNRLVRGIALATLCAAGSSAYADLLPLWEIQGSGNRVYLLGSVHFLRPSDYPLPAGIEAAYADADELVMEIDLDDLDSTEAQTITSRMAIDGDDLPTSIGAKAYAEAQALAATVGIDLQPLMPFEPWFAALMITQIRMLQMGFDPAWGIETQLGERADHDGKPISGLETLAGQLAFMDTLDADTQRLFLLESLKDEAETEDEMQTVMSAWHSGDMAVLAELQSKLMRDAPRLGDALFTRRNRNWVPQIIELTKQNKNYLVIVGAMHLAGEGSVLELLAEKGIRAKQLSDERTER